MTSRCQGLFPPHPFFKGKALGTRLSENVQTNKPRRIPNEDLLFVLAAGYHANYCTNKLVPQVHSWWWRLWWVWRWWLLWLWWLSVVAVVDAVGLEVVVDAANDIKLTKF